MAEWLTLKQISQRYNVNIRTLKKWAKVGYISYARLGDQYFFDNETLTNYLNASRNFSYEAAFLSEIVEEKKKEKDRVLAEFNDMLYVMKTQKHCEPLYAIIIQELSYLILDPVKRSIFYSISMGEPIESVASRHHYSSEEAMAIYENCLKGLKYRKGFISLYRKRSMSYAFRYFAYTENPKLPDDSVYEIPIRRLATTRLSNILKKVRVTTVGELLEFISIKGWKGLAKLDYVGEQSFMDLVFKLRKLGVWDHQMESIVFHYLKKHPHALK